MTKTYRAFLLASAVCAIASPAFAAAKKAPPPDPRVGVLEQELRDIESQLADIKRSQGQPVDTSGTDAALGDLKRSTSAQYDDLNSQIASQTKVTTPNGRLTFTSPDGAFSLAIRSLVQFDAGYFSQGKNPGSVDLSSGTNFRRAQIGIAGTAFTDWSYNFTYDFGGNGVEKNGYIYYAYLQYDGLGPFHVRGGAIAPFAGIEDATGSPDLLFLERPSVTDIARNVAGSPGREGIDFFAQGDTYLLSAAFTTKKTTDAATFDSQQAVVGRASWLAINDKDSDFHWLLDADYTHVFKAPDATANVSNSGTFSFSNGPELSVDASKTVNTGTITNVGTVDEWGLESAVSYGPFYGQGGYFHFDVTRTASALPDPDFDGWYALATWSLTGESHAYDPTTASFRGLRPTHPLGTKGGFGAFELKARWSDIDLDYNPFSTAGTGGIAGGKQDIWTVGVNWYPTAGLRFALDYDNIQVNHVNAPAGDISASAIALRSQISF